MNNERKYQLCIAHRACPNLSKGAIHVKNKTELLIRNAESIVKALKNIKTKVIIIFDNCDKEQIDSVTKIFENQSNIDLETILTDGIGNSNTFLKQIDILIKNRNIANYLYFSEDDYLYDENAFTEMMSFLPNKNVHFVSPLDHPDRYTHRIPEKTKMKIIKGSHYDGKKVETTCCTFMTKPEVIIKSKEQLQNYAIGGDGIMGMSITKIAIFIPSIMLKTICSIIKNKITNNYDNHDYGYLPKSVGGLLKFKIFKYKKGNLGNSVPTLAVHVCDVSIPPNAEKIEDYKKLLR